MNFQQILETILTYGSYFMMGVGVGIGLYYAKYTIPFIEWLKGGIENQDGSLENKDLQIAFVTLIVAFIVVTSYLGAEYSDPIVWGGWGTLAGLYGIKEIYGQKNGKD